MRRPMNSASLSSQTLARVLLSREAARDSADAGLPISLHAARVCEVLRTVLTAFAGSAGYRALLARALVLAKADSTVFASVHVSKDGTLAGVEASVEASVEGTHGRLSQCGCEDGPVLVAHLLDLLIALIGRSLTLRLVSDAWPDAPVESWNSLIQGAEKS